MILRKSTLVGAVCVAVIAAATQAEAGWGSWGSSGGSTGYGSSGASAGSHGSSGGSWGSHGSSGGSAGYSSHGSSGGRVGLFARWHARKAWRRAQRANHSSGGSWGSSGGSSGGSWGGSSGGSWGSHGSSGGSWGSSGGSSGGQVIETSDDCCDGTATEVPADAPVEPAVEGDAAAPVSAQVPADGALITVNVPSDAQVFVNGRATKSTGEVRRFLSKGLLPGQRYTYQVKAEMTRDGRTVSHTKTVHLTGGRQAELAFDAQTVVPTTVVTVNVPEDAMVTLSGQETKSTGPVRVFATQQLEDGQTWSGYTVKVTVERDGETLTREKTIDLAAGDTPTLDFEFDETVKLASAE